MTDNVAPHGRDATPHAETLAVPLARLYAVAGISRSRAYREHAAGNLRLLKCGRQTLVDGDSLRAFLAALPALTRRASEV